MKRPNRPSLNALRAFDVAARHESFLRAAEELNVTPGAVSHRIKELEGEIGISLFHRHAQGVELTETGQLYHKRIAKALIEIEFATDRLTVKSITGPLVVSAPESMTQYWLVPRLSRLSLLHPGLELTIKSSDELLDLHSNDSDVNIRYGAGYYPGLTSELMMLDAVCVLVPAFRGIEADRSDVAGILSNEVLLEDTAVRAEEPWMSWAPWLRLAGLSPDQSPGPRLKFSNTACTLAACIHGAGASIGRMSLAFDMIQRQQLHVVSDWRTSDFSYFIVTRVADQENPRVQAFKGWLSDKVADFVQRVERDFGLGILPR